MQTANLTALRAEWNANKVNERGVRLQDEFRGDEKAFIAFMVHAAAGHVTIYGSDIGRVYKPAPRAAGAGGDLSVTALKREWQANRPNDKGVPLQDEFGGDEAAFVAFSKRYAAGHIRIVGGKC